MSNRVSVIIPAYRAAGTIRRAVDSVLAQTVAADEIIVVDDGSPDHQNQVIEEAYGSRVILVRKPNGKTASARNAGIERAKGDFIAFLDADDYWEPEKLGKQLAVFEQHPQVGMVAGAYWEQVPTGERMPGGLHHRVALECDCVVRATGAAAFRLAALTWTGTVIIRRDAIGDHRFITGLEPAEDRDFWMQVVSRHPAYYLSEQLATYVLEPGSISRSNVERDCCSMLAVVRRHRAAIGTIAACEWQSHVLYRWAACESAPSTALPLLMRSFWTWPIPYWSVQMRRMGRIKRLFVLISSAFSREVASREMVTIKHQ